MGTVFSFDVRGPDIPALRRALDDAVTLLHRVDEVFSTYRPDSAVSRLGRGETVLEECPSEVALVLGLCEEAGRVSGGWFSHTPGGTLDPSGLVKGWAIEAAARLLREAGASGSCVNGGGDLQLCGEASAGAPWRIGVADPLRRGLLAAVVSGRDLAVATTGTAERGLHVLDPRTGRPVAPLASATVTGPGAGLTDAYATAAFAMGGAALDWVASLDGYEALLIGRDGRTACTPGFPRSGS
ncbi:FAD:protein FMN transferase [Streptomyces meridianus]|uniref:FAD:protein FMN transferase n=1 Tax=Streptomyces meridianus TaxID=2938945 RepID=A0ABT0X9G1_9ACTN|nr:FAD:protein FMN transferase [Streptomyces meridianus]MCM2579166.1 FAD:protein FMN transferase [Streptomyces meridianus]